MIWACGSNSPVLHFLATSSWNNHVLSCLYVGTCFMNENSSGFDWWKSWRPTLDASLKRYTTAIIKDIPWRLFQRVVHPRHWSEYRTLVLSRVRSPAGDVISHELTGPHMKNDAHTHIRPCHGWRKRKKNNERVLGGGRRGCSYNSYGRGTSSVLLSSTLYYA